MMQRRSPPKHRHDGDSPLPMGMDWSPPPRKWIGKQTVWPHDPRTGWSYCITIPSWVVIPKSRNSDPLVFYRVQVCVQSPEGVTTMHGVLRRFNDFLKLLADLKKAFPRKSFPPAPPKGILRLKNRAMLEERRCSLEEWMTKLLSNIDLSRSVIVASFLELEAAARSAFQDVDQKASEANSDGNSTSSSPLMHPNLSLFHAGSSSITSDHGSDTAYETSELGAPSLGQDDISESGIEDLVLDEDLTNPIEKLVKYSMSNIDEGLSMGQTILEQLEDFSKHKGYSGHINDNLGKGSYNGNSSKALFLASNGSGLFSGPQSSNMMGHAKKLSAESVGSDHISFQVDEISNSGGGFEVFGSAGTVGNSRLHRNAQIVHPLDQSSKLNRILLTMHQRLVNAKTDMEDLIARLNQEIAVKDCLNKKVNGLEVELETTKQKNKENLEQAIMIERERFTQVQWDMEELKQKSFEMELKLKSKQDEKSLVESTEQLTIQESDGLLQELDATKQQLEDLSRRYEELETISKGDIKVLVKEVKSLRRSQAELKQELSQAQTEKFEAEKLLQQERELLKNATARRKKLLSDCRILHDRLKEYNINLSINEEGSFTDDSTTLADASLLLSTSNDQIEEAQLIAGFDETVAKDINRTLSIDDDTRVTDDELRKILADILMENAKLKKQVNSAILRALISDPNITKSANDYDDDVDNEQHKKSPENM